MAPVYSAPALREQFLVRLKKVREGNYVDFADANALRPADLHGAQIDVSMATAKRRHSASQPSGGKTLRKF